jgi:hypothetical protein
MTEIAGRSCETTPESINNYPFPEWLARTAFNFEGLNHASPTLYHPVCVEFYSKRLNFITLNI